MEHSLHFRIIENNGAHLVRLSVNGAAWIETPADVGWLDTHPFATSLALIEEGRSDLDDLKLVGTQLWKTLLAGHIAPRVDELRKAQTPKSAHRLTFLLELPSNLDRLPWEALYDDRRNDFVACNPLCSIVRHPPDTIDVPQPLSRAHQRLRVLVVIPEGSHLSVEHEWRNIQLVFKAISHAVEDGEPKRLAGRITADSLATELRNQVYDIVHFVGHGQIDDASVPTIRLNDAHGGEHWIPAEAFATLFRHHPARLVVLNCCLAASPSPRHGFAGLGPYLIAAGISAVVAMRYEIADAVAIKFAQEFYKNLFAEPVTGRVDIAVSAAREAILRNHTKDTARGFATPLLFLAPEQQRLFDIPSIPHPPDDSTALDERANEALSPKRSPLRRWLIALAVLVGATLAIGIIVRHIRRPPCYYCGVVRDASHKKLVGVLVELVGTECSQMTDSAARFNFRDCDDVLLSAQHSPRVNVALPDGTLIDVPLEPPPDMTSITINQKTGDFTKMAMAPSRPGQGFLDILNIKTREIDVQTEETLEQGRLDLYVALEKAVIDARNDCKDMDGAAIGFPERVNLTFSPDGSVKVETSLEQTEAGRCVERIFGKISIPAFEGPPLAVSKSFVLR